MAHYQTLVDNYNELRTYIQLCHVSLLIAVLQRGVLQVEYPLCHGSPCRMVTMATIVSLLTLSLISFVSCVMCHGSPCREVSNGHINQIESDFVCVMCHVSQQSL